MCNSLSKKRIIMARIWYMQLGFSSSVNICSASQKLFSSGKYIFLSCRYNRLRKCGEIVSLLTQSIRIIQIQDQDCKEDFLFLFLQELLGKRGQKRRKVRKKVAKKLNELSQKWMSSKWWSCTVDNFSFSVQPPQISP